MSKLPYLWYGQNYSTAGTYTRTVVSTTGGCDTLATLNLVIASQLTKTDVVTTCTSKLPYVWYGQNYSTAGTYTRTVVSTTGGCDTLATLNLVIASQLTKTDDVTTCVSKLPYVWYGQNYSTAGTYTRTVASTTGGCDTLATLNLVIASQLTKTDAITICPAQQPYSWYGQSYPAAGTYTRTVLSTTGGCDTLATLNLTISSVISGTPQSLIICALNLPYVWNGNPYNAAGTYTTTLKNQAGCDSLATLILTVTPVATASLTGSGTICSGNSATIRLTMTGNGPWTVVYSDGVTMHTLNDISTSTYDFVVSPAQTTTYSLVSVTDGKCINTNLNSSVTVTVNPSPTGIRYPDVNATTNVSIQLQARNLGAGSTYIWSPSVGLNSPTLINPVFRHNATVEYLITITTPAGCDVTDSLRVVVADPPDVLVPTAWTPNRDGHNDLLTAFYKNIAQLNYFRIYNRWGQLVFETRDMNAGWDGTYNGQPQPMDTYTWIVEAVGTNGEIVRKTGNSTLLR